MHSMLKIEFHRLKQAWYLWGILAILFVCTNFYPIWVGAYRTTAAVLGDISKNVVAPLLAGGIYMGLVHSEDRNAGLTRTWIAAGIPRQNILLARFVHSMAGSLLILAADSLLAVTAAAFAAGQPVMTGWGASLQMLGCMLPFWFAMIALLQLAITLAGDSGPNIAVVVVITFLLTAVTNLLGQEPAWQPLLRMTPLAWLMRCGGLALSASPDGLYWLAAGIALLLGVAALIAAGLAVTVRAAPPR